jgi:ATP-dependent DNA helicase DinG
VGLQCLARQFNTGQIGRFCKDLEHFGPQLALGYDHWRSLVDAVERATADLLEAVSDQSSGRRAWQFNAPAGVDAPAWWRAMADLGESVQAVTHLLETIRETSPPLGSLCERATTIVADIDTFSQEVEPGWVRWLEAGRVLRMFQSPLSLASAWTEQSKALIDSANPGRKSWIFTSATLGHDNELSWFVQSCGLQGADVLRVESPFNYGVQGMLYVPTHLPKSADPSHSADVARLVAQGVQILGGRTLVLTTTLGAMRAIGAALRQHLAGTAEVEVLIQGQHSKRVLLERFRRVVNGTPGGHVLVACVSYWEGIDIPGDVLQMVVIDKLPFAPPDDPLVGARSKDLRAAGKNPFQNLHLPTAAMALKQGAGRLIRCETDRGILVICDNRLTEASYGKKILAALPPFTTLSCHAHFIEALESLTRTATMNRQTL